MYEVPHKSCQNTNYITLILANAKNSYPFVETTTPSFIKRFIETYEAIQILGPACKMQITK